MFDIKNIKRYYRIELRKIRSFLSSQTCREYLIFLFFVFVSFLFWALQTLDEVYQTDLKMPVRLKNVPKDAVLIQDLPECIQVRVEDRGTVLLNYMWGRTFYPLTFDFQDYQDQEPYIRFSKDELLRRISGQLNVTTKLLMLHPDTLGVICTRSKGKLLPVHLNGQVRAGMQYYISNISFTPDSVMVYAPDKMLDTLRYVSTELLDEGGVTDTLRRRVYLRSVKGMKCIPSYTDMSVLADMYSEKTVEVPVVGVGFPHGKTLRTFPSKVQLSFRVGLKHFKEVTAKDFSVEVVYDDIVNSKPDRLVLKVSRKPSFVEYVRVLPSSVDYLIEQQGIQ